MIRFLLLGLIRDKSRSRLPVIVVAIGVMLTVLMHAYITGVMGDTLELTAKFSTGHLKVMTRAYSENASQTPNDLALLGVDSLIEDLQAQYPEIQWIKRIKFGGLIDVPDKTGNTKEQGSAMGLGLDLFSPDSGEVVRLNLQKSLVQGKLPSAIGEVLLSDEFAKKLGVGPGEEITLIGSTMFGGMAFYNFNISGTIQFGTTALDRGTIIADIHDVQRALDMDDAAGEIVGFFSSNYYEDTKAQEIMKEYNQSNTDEKDEFSPVMVSLRDQDDMGMLVDLTDSMSTIVTIVFIIAMSLVLWNAGLLGALRRYGEIGIRLAIGEEKGHVYRTLIYESFVIGVAGTIVGTFFGLFFAWLIQTYGIEIGAFTKGSSVMMPSVIRARITPVDLYLGFIPGVISTVVGTMLAGIGIYKRKTAQLFKELEA